MLKISYKQRKLLEFIKIFYDANEFMPTIHEMARYQEVNISLVHRRIYSLECKGYLKRQKNVARGIVLTKKL